MARTDYDVVIAGGGIAGVAAAAALKDFGWSVLIVEPGQRSDRRLGGELIHPAGVTALKELGLFDEVAFRDAAPIKGFVVLPGPTEDWSDIRLPYADNWGPRSAIALDHVQLRAALQTAAESMPHVTVRKGTRVVGVENGRSEVKVAVAGGKNTLTMTCRLLVAADGASSSVRTYAGIAHWRRPISSMTGYLIGDANLPAPGFGHLFLGGSAPLLVYEIGGRRVRVLFDQPIGQSSVPTDVHRSQVVAAVPQSSLRAEIAAAMEAQRGLRFVSADILVERSTLNRVVLVGDAGGCCHPLTATGMTIGVSDALRLRDTLWQAGGNVALALARYSRQRRAPQRSRLLVASALHDACSATKPEGQLIRAGLIRYWRQNARGRQSTMAILAMSDRRLYSALREMFIVIRHGIAAKWNGWSLLGVGGSLRLMAGLTGVVMRQVGFAMRAR